MAEEERRNDKELAFCSKNYNNIFRQKNFKLELIFLIFL